MEGGGRGVLAGAGCRKVFGAGGHVQQRFGGPSVARRNGPPIMPDLGGRSCMPGREGVDPRSPACAALWYVRGTWLPMLSKVVVRWIDIRGRGGFRHGRCRRSCGWGGEGHAAGSFSPETYRAAPILSSD